MRLWSFHPKYLDNVGLSRAINEAISGYKALTGKQKMWQNHSQLTRFKDYNNHSTKHHYFNNVSKELLRFYLDVMLTEFIDRKTDMYESTMETDLIDYCFEGGLDVTTKQLEYEWQHYLNKLKTQKGRDKTLYEKLKDIKQPEPHPLFGVVEGEIEHWEKVKE